MPKLLPSTMLMATALSALCAALLACFGMPSIRHHGLSRISPEHVLIQISNDRDIRARSSETLAPGVPLDAQRTLPESWVRQFHFQIAPNARAVGGASLWIPAASGPAVAFVNGVPVGQGDPQLYRGPGLGSFQLAVEVPAFSASSADWSADIALLSAPVPAHIPAIYLGPAGSSALVARESMRWQTGLKHASAISSLIGLLAAFVGLILSGHHRFVFASGLFIAAGLACWLMPPGADNSNSALALPSGAGLIFIGSAAGIFAGFKRGDVLGAALAGSASAALVGAFLAVWLIYFANEIAALNTFAHLATTFQMPITAIVMPALSFAEGRAFFSDLAVSRQQIADQAKLIDAQTNVLEDQVRALAVAEERQRFVRDIHDGIGGQLLSLLTRLRMGRVAVDDVTHEIQDSLKDLRLIVDSLDTVGSNLETALAHFRVRGAAQLEAAQIELNWHQAEPLPDLQADPRDILNLYRILQEALTNCVRHANARTFSVAVLLLPETPGVRILISDDGCGMRTTSEKSGKGLASMAARASAIGASIAIEPVIDSKGTQIQINWPSRDQRLKQS